MPLRTANQGRSLIDSHQFELVHILTRVYESGFGYARGNIHSTLINSMQLLFSSDRGTRVEKTLMQTLTSQLSSTLMQLLFSFDRGMRVEKTLMQILASQLSCNSIQLLFSFDRGMRVENANSRFSTLVNSHATLVLV